MRLATKRDLSADQIRDLVRHGLGEEGLLPGYLGRPLTGRERTRLRLYSTYLYLIMVTEGVVRGFDPVAHEPNRRRALEALDAELTALDRQSLTRGSA